MTLVNTHEAKTHLSKLLEEVNAGKEVIIAHAGKPIAKLVPFQKSLPRKPGLLKGKVPDSFFEELPEDEMDAWQR